jgi:hypothetical protein
MKNPFKHEAWGPIGVVLGNIAILDWLIFPGLTVSSSFVNVLSVILFIAIFLFDIDYVKFKYFTKSEEEKALEAKWKADLEEKMKQVKRKSKTK